jgi:hypothetical protein
MEKNKIKLITEKQAERLIDNLILESKSNNKPHGKGG